MDTTSAPDYYHPIPDDPAIIQPLFQQLKKTASNSLPALSVDFRIAQMQRVILGLHQLQNQFAHALNQDLGLSPFYNQAFSVKMCSKEFQYMVKHVHRLAKKRPTDTPIFLMAKSYIQPQPFGLTLIMGAWNYPLVTTLKPLASAMAAGNSVILKPSQMSPCSSNVLKKLFEKYLDGRFYRVLEGQMNVSKAVSGFPFDHIIFTGSPQKGRLVAQAAAKHLVPCILQLGGKSPTIVDADADLQNAALRITFGRFLNCGQTCIAPDYVLVHHSIKDRLVGLICSKIQQFYGERPSEEIGKLVNEFHARRLKQYLQEEHGGKIVTGGKVDIAARTMQPTVVVGPKVDSKMMVDEIFGPILPILDFKEIDQTIRFITDRDKPLALYYFGYANKNYVLDRTTSGGAVINDTLIHISNPWLPFGGVGTSGSGAYNGDHGFNQCSHMRAVSDAWVANAGPLMTRYPPFTDSKAGKFMMLLKWLGMGEKQLIKKLLWLVAVLVLLMVSYGRCC